MIRYIHSLIFICVISIAVSAQTEVIFYTSMGQFMVVMEDSLAPITSGNFVKLVKEKYYDGVIFHRVIDNFMIQGGDPTGTGSGGPGYTIDDEFHVSLSNVKGTISMANSGPNTGGSQFFINLVNNTYLDYNKSPFTSKHAVFGHVTSGFEVVQAIGKVQTNGQNRPVEDVVMDSVRVVEYYAIPLPVVFSHPIAPNPVTQDPYLQLNFPDSGAVLVRCFDLQGNILWESTIVVKKGRDTVRLTGLYESLTGNGMYILRLESGEAVRFIKAE